jgi:NADP-dependent 3-hydroxy acid dehydrogenase YdfG
MSEIKDKVVVITGASSGIGEATALLLAERGAKVVLGARGPDRLESLAARIAASGGEAAYARTDVKRRDVSNLVGLAIERYGKLDVLVNNAGVAPISLLDELRVDDWEEMIDVNLKGVSYGIAAALPVFRRQSFGHLVNVISTGPNAAFSRETPARNRRKQGPHKKEAHPKASASLFAGFFLTCSFSSCLRGGTPPTA